MSKLTRWAEKTGKKAERWVSERIPHQHSAERRAANQAVSEQIGFYQEQKSLMEKEATAVEQERQEQKRKIAQKQIKSLRSTYRSPGFMDEASTGLSDRLGG